MSFSIGNSIFEKRSSTIFPVDTEYTTPFPLFSKWSVLEVQFFFFFFRILRQSLPLKSTEFDLSRYKFLVFNAVLYSVPLTCMCASTVKLFCLLARYTYVPYDARRIHINWVYGWELACSFFSLQVQSLRFERRSGRLTPDTTMIVLSDMLLGCNPRVLPKCIVFNANTPSALNLTREHAECAVCLYRRFVSVVRL